MSYNLLNPVHAIVDGDMSGDLTSSVVEVKLQDNIGIQVSWTGAPLGAIGVQISMDHLEDSKGNIIRAGNWVSLPLSPDITASGSADTAYIDLNQMSAVYVRVTYTFSGGTGVLNCFINGKGV